MSQRSSRAPRGPAARVVSSTLAAVLLAQLALPAAARADGGAADVHAVEELSNQAYAQVNAGKYAEAIGSYMKAYEISKAGALLFNIATIYDRKLHERTLAMEYFRRYLEATDADAEFARKATERLTALKAEVAAEERARSSAHVAPPPTAPASAPASGSAPPSPAADGSSPSPAADSSLSSPPPDSAPSGGSALRPVGVVLGVVGLAAVGGALGLGAVAKSKADQANAYCGASWCSNSQGVTLDQQAASFATASTVTFVAGAALLVTGVTLFLAAPRAKTATAASITISPRMAPSSGGLSVQGSF